MKKMTVAFESEVLLCLRAKAAATGRSTSDLVNEAVRVYLVEDAEPDQAEAVSPWPDVEAGILAKE